MDSEKIVWVPKPFGPGDIDGDGTSRLLGQPDLPLRELVVRETAQNSWGARSENVVPTYGVHFHSLDEPARQTLRNHLLAEGAERVARLSEALEAPQLHVAEIVDRGTKGLGGPERNDQPIHENSPRDWADFVLNVGSPRDSSQGGGTYGFGKTAAYLLSRCHTIIIWSRYRDEAGVLRSRLIASAIGPSFEQEGRRYTGRHWWGRAGDGNKALLHVLPVRDAEADRLASALFCHPFHGDDTGTSILILDPTERPTSDDLREAWAAAVVDNLWPKLIPGQDARWRMDISVTVDGAPLNLDDRMGTPQFRSLSKCLAAVRAAQGAGPGAPSHIIVRPLSSERPPQLLGHLAFVRMDAEDAKESAGTITTMRNGLELVVRRWLPSRTVSDRAWLAVFKPIDDNEVEDAFAKSEPPAHDRWNIGRLDGRERTFVSVAHTRMKDAIKSLLAGPAITGSGAAASTGKVAHALRGLMPTSTTPTASPGAPAKQRTTARAAVMAASPMPTDAADRVQTTKLVVEVSGTNGPYQLFAEHLRMAMDGGATEARDVMRILRWTDVSRSRTVEHGDGIVADANGDFEIVVEHPAGEAIDVAFAVEERG